MPDIGDFAEVEIVEVMVSLGDEVAAEDSLITLETDKAAMDVPSPAAGKVVEMAVGDKLTRRIRCSTSSLRTRSSTGTGQRLALNDRRRPVGLQLHSF